MGFVNVFGGNAVAASNIQYLALAISANTTLVWPLESAEGQDYLAAQLDVTPSTGGLALLLPPANAGTTGISSVVTNKGASSFTIEDNGANSVQVVAAGESYILALTDNTTVNGVWETVKLGAGAASGSLSSALAGPGLVALGTLLASNIVTNLYTTDQTLTTTHRATANQLTGTAAHTFTLDALATNTNGWWTIVSNDSTAALTIDASGADTIDGLPNITIPASGAAQPYSALIVAAAGGYTTYFLPPTVIPISAGGTGGTTPTQALQNLGGTAVGISIFTAPTAAAILAILGITQSLLQESTIATNQIVGSNSTGTVYVATTGVTLTLPQASTVTKGFYIGGYAQGGAITLTPNAADALNGGTTGSNLVIPEGSSFLLLTDAGTPNGAWWPLFLVEPPPGVWAVAAGTSDAITVSYSPANTSLTDGMLLGFRAAMENVTQTPTFSPDGLTAHTITKWGGKALLPSDIPGGFAEVLLRYNLANTRWELLNPASAEPPWAIATGSADAIAAAYTPSITALTDGLLLGVRASAANVSTTPNFSPDGITPHTITKLGGVALIAADIAGHNHEILLRYNLPNTRWELLNPANPPLGSGTAAGTYRNLKILNNVGSPTTQAGVTADSVAVAPVGGTPTIVLPNVNINLDISTGGAYGLDTGAVAASTWYAVWVIWNGTAISGLFSTSATAPTLPTGYTYYARVGWMRTDGSAHLLRTIQYGNVARYTTPPLPTLGSGAQGSVTTPTWSAVAVGNFVPSTASAIAFAASASGTNGCTMVAPNSSYGAYNSTTNPPPVVNLSAGSTAFQTMMGEFLLESTSIYWASQASNSLLQCYGWSDNL